MRIQKPKNGGSFYYNYKHHHSIILMAIAGPEYECLYAVVGSNGRVNDSGVWNKTSLLQGIEDGTFTLPKDAKLPNGEEAPYVFLSSFLFLAAVFFFSFFFLANKSPFLISVSLSDVAILSCSTFNE